MVAAAKFPQRIRRNKKLSRRALKRFAEAQLWLFDVYALIRPTSREQCIGGPRPCPWVSCRHHTWLEITRDGLIKLNHPHLKGPWEMTTPSCSLDSQPPMKLYSQVGDSLGLSRERVRLLEGSGVRKVAAALNLTEQEARQELAKLGEVKAAMSVDFVCDCCGKLIEGGKVEKYGAEPLPKGWGQVNGKQGKRYEHCENPRCKRTAKKWAGSDER